MYVAFTKERTKFEIKYRTVVIEMIVVGKMKRVLVNNRWRNAVRIEGVNRLDKQRSGKYNYHKDCLRGNKAKLLSTPVHHKKYALKNVFRRYFFLLTSRS